MDEPKIEPARLSGGCQCGTVRYALSMKPVGVHYCHCRMCQRAVGNVFAALAPVLKTHLRWINRKPRFYASSSAAKRGYCPECGTPLSFAYNASNYICVTLGSLDHPERVPPTIHYGVESQVPWLHIPDGLPREQTAVNEYMQGMTANQFRPVG